MYQDAQGTHRDIKIGPDWGEIEAAKHEREDRPIRTKFAPYARLGTGHTKPDLCRVRMDY